MVDENLLAVLNCGDEENHLVKSFFDSLPPGTRNVLHSIGYVGNLEQNLATFRPRDKRHFIILRLPDSEDLADGYFVSKEQVALIKIPDELYLKICYKHQDTELINGARVTLSYSGSIDDMVQKYQELSSMDPRQLLAEGISRSDYLLQGFTRKQFVFFGRRRTVPTYVSVGLESRDRKYLLRTTGACGPHVVQLAR